MPVLFDESAVLKTFDNFKAKMAVSGGKQYGLILSQKSTTKPATLPRPSIFGDDSDDETSVGESLQKEAIKKKTMKQTRLEMQKALAEDSSVYEYDSVYDDLQKQRLETNKKVLGGKDKKPKYINQLLRAVEERKKEQERRDDRKIQKEREAEGEKFADKEAYVTSAYRQKLKERQEELEKEKRAEAIEAALDVKKQKDLSGFYRHFLNQTVGEEAVPDNTADKKDKSKENTPVEDSPPHVNNSDAESQSDVDQKTLKTEFSKTSTNSSHSKRQYRQRSPSSGSGDERDKDRKREKEKKSHKHEDRTRDREDKHSHRKDNRDHTRERDREADQERRREGRDKERDHDKDRHEKRNRDLEDRHKERGSHKSEDKEKRREPDMEKIQDNNDKSKEKGTEDAELNTQAISKFAKRSDEQTVSSARDRYLARQMARSAAKYYIEKEDE